MDYSDYLYSEETGEIIGAALEVHKIIGCGFTEYVYQSALEKEFQLRGIPYEKEKVFNVYYKGYDININKEFHADFVCYGKIIVELKAVDRFTDEHTSQVFNYLKASGLKLGLLLNFGTPLLGKKRILRPYHWDNLNYQQRTQS